jgi:hypothetical protein
MKVATRGTAGDKRETKNQYWISFSSLVAEEVDSPWGIHCILFVYIGTCKSDHRIFTTYFIPLPRQHFPSCHNPSLRSHLIS